MNIFLLRHGTRNYSIGDVPLNDEGQEEAQELSKDKELLKATHIYSSPKKRARMTVEPLSDHLGKPIIQLEALDQMMSHENESEFRSRVNSFVDKMEEHSENDCIVLCTHSDWLSVATELIPTDELHLKHYMFACAEYLHFRLTEGIWKLQKARSGTVHS